MTSTAQDLDPFEGGTSVPSLSFKDAPVGTTYTGTITEAASLVQRRDYESGDPEFWDDGKPKMSAVLRLAVNELDGEERSLWAKKPSALFAALAEAQKAAGARFEVGGTLAVKYTGDKPNAKNPRLNPAKQYAARYTPPKPADPFGGQLGATQVDDAPPF
jgi:hypothetical protein